MKTKILWLSNAVLTSEKTKSTGTWLQSMAVSLITADVELYNISQSNVSDIINKKSDIAEQWVFPTFKLKNGLPTQNILNKLLQIIASIKPDVIQVWGTESFWGLLIARGFLKDYKCVLDTQGLKSSCVPVFYGGLSFKEIIKCIHLKELLFFNHSVIFSKWQHAQWEKYENEILSNIDNVSTQSEWIRSWILPRVKYNAQIFNTGISVREEFVTANKWSGQDRCKRIIFAMSSEGKPYKGLHIAIKALGVLKEIYNDDVELRIAGNWGVTRNRFMIPGYTKYLLSLIKRLKLESNVKFLGSLDSTTLIGEMLNADVMVHPSFVESYSVSLAEAMILGVPSVVSFVGAMPELAVNNESALFYNSTDYKKCAYQIFRLLTDGTLAKKISEESISMAIVRNSSSFVLDQQLSIYKKILGQ